MLGALVALFVLATGASADPAKFRKFQHCPYEDQEVFRCLYSITTAGSITLGDKKVPIVNPVTLRAGYGGVVRDGFSRMVPPVKARMISGVQPVPGGLVDIFLSGKPPPAVKLLAALLSAAKLARVEVSLEPAGEARLSEAGLRSEEGVALELPVKVRIGNPLLGDGCYIGSKRSPLSWNLTTSITELAPGKTISGETGTVQFVERGRILRLVNNKLVDAEWSAPAANGCGSGLSFLVDPLVDAAIGLPAGRGNLATLSNTIDITSSFVARSETHPLAPGPS